MGHFVVSILWLEANAFYEVLAVMYKAGTYAYVLGKMRRS